MRVLIVLVALHFIGCSKQKPPLDCRDVINQASYSNSSSGMDCIERKHVRLYTTPASPSSTNVPQDAQLRVINGIGTWVWVRDENPILITIPIVREAK